MTLPLQRPPAGSPPPPPPMPPTRRAPGAGGTTQRLGSAAAPRPYGSRQRPVPPQSPQSPQATRVMTGFWVVVDGVELPTFTECNGLAAEYAVESWVEGGQNEFVHQLPGRISFSPVTLTRYVDGASGTLAAWFSSVADPAQQYRTARISAVDEAGAPIARWDLSDVFASRYTGPSFVAGSAQAPTESVELVHHGFSFALEPSPPGGAGPGAGSVGAGSSGAGAGAGAVLR